MSDFDKTEVYVVDEDGSDYHYDCYPLPGIIKKEMVHFLEELDDERVLFCDKCGKEIVKPK